MSLSLSPSGECLGLNDCPAGRVTGDGTVGAECSYCVSNTKSWCYPFGLGMTGTDSMYCMYGQHVVYVRTACSVCTDCMYCTYGQHVLYVRTVCSVLPTFSLFPLLPFVSSPLSVYPTPSYTPLFSPLLLPVISIFPSPFIFILYPLLRSVCYNDTLSVLRCSDDAAAAHHYLPVPRRGEL